MHRFLTPLPAVYDLGHLGALTATFWPGLLGCNIVDDDGTPSLAVYLDDDAPSGLDGWAAAVAAHVPVPPAPDPSVAVLAAVTTARNEVAGFAPTNGTRQAVEALATAVEVLVQGVTS